MTPTDTPLFDQTAAEHRDYLLGLLSTRPPTCRQIIAAVDAAAEEAWLRALSVPAEVDLDDTEDEDAEAPDA